MDEKLKRRLVGATVLVSLVVIFVPMLIQEDADREHGIHGSNIPPRPDIEGRFNSRVLPAEDEPLIPPLAPPENLRPELPLTVPGAAPPATEKAPPVASVPPPVRSAPQTPRVGLSAWVVQVASLSSRHNADKLAAKLKKYGFSAFIEQAYVHRKTVYRVRVGPEIERRRAQKLARQIHGKLKLKGQVIRYP